MDLLSVTMILLYMAEAYHINIDKYLGLGYIPNKFSGELFIHSLKNENDEWNIILLEKIAKIFGVSVDDIFNNNKDALYCYYYQNAEFFETYDKYLEKLKTVRDNAYSGSEVLISFDEIKTLICGFSVFISRYKKLFLRCLDEELEPKEIMEMNFLAHFLEITDVYISDRVLKYDTVRYRRELYIEEISKYDWPSIFVSHRLLSFEPWNCIEFAYNNIEQLLLNDINVNWKESLGIWLKKFEKGVILYFSGSVDFKCDIQYDKEFYRYDPLDEPAEKNEKWVIDWLESLYKLLESWDENEGISTFMYETFMGNDMSCRLEKRKQYIE